MDNWESKSLNRQSDYKKFLSQSDNKRYYKKLNTLHEEAFSKISCLDCARCCKNYSPRFKQNDIRRVSKALGMKSNTFIDTYLVLDDEGDYVVTTKPCPFLGVDNTCNIYEYRPNDCARFPYTNEDILFKKKNITLKNSTFCPAVYYVLERLIGDDK